MIQYQILQTNITRTVWQTVRRITNEIWGVTRLKFSLSNYEETTFLTVKNFTQYLSFIFLLLLFILFSPEKKQIKDKLN